MSKSVLYDLNKFDTIKPRKYTPHPLYDNFGGIIPKKSAKEQLGLNIELSYILFFGFIRDYKAWIFFWKLLPIRDLENCQ